VWNVGTGVAVVQRTRYRLVLNDTEVSRLNHDAVIARLGDLGWREGTTYKLSRFSKGFVLGPEHRISIFEIAHASIKDVRALDLELTFASRSGEEYRKDIFLIPRPPATEPLQELLGSSTGGSAPAQDTPVAE
jgi:hypothetical protein